MERLNSSLQNVQSLNAKIEALGSCQVQKIYSTAYALCFVLRFPSETTRLWVGRGGQAEGVLYPGPECPAAYRVLDRFLELQRRTLKGFKLVSVNFNEKTHFLLQAKAKEVEVSCLYTWASGKLYYSSFEKDKVGVRLFSPWLNPKRQKGSSDESVKSILDLHKGEIQASQRNPLTAAAIFPSDQRLKKVINKKRKFLIRKEKNINKDLEKLLLADKIQNWAARMTEESILGRTVTFEGVKIKLQNAENFYQKRDLIFKKAKSFKAAQSLLAERLSDVQAELQSLSDESLTQNVKFELVNQIRPTAPAWAQKIQDPKLKSMGNSVEQSMIYEGQGLKLAVGLNAQANDALRVKWAKKGDLWFHLDNQPSAHAFLKQTKEKAISIEELEVIASALKVHTGLKSDEIDLVYTKVQFIKPVKGKPGLVKFSKEKRIRVKYQQDWKEILANL